MRKYHNIGAPHAHEVLKEYFMADPRYEISTHISRFVPYGKEEMDCPGILWDNVLDVVWDIYCNVLFIDLD